MGHPAPETDWLSEHSPELDPLFSRGLESAYYRVGYILKMATKIRKLMDEGKKVKRDFKAAFPEYKPMWLDPKLDPYRFTVERIQQETGEALGWWGDNTMRGRRG